MEKILIQKIENGIRLINKGLKTPQEANIGIFLNKLKDINKPMFEDLMNNYKAACTQHTILYKNK